MNDKFVANLNQAKKNGDDKYLLFVLLVERKNYLAKLFGLVLNVKMQL